MIQVYDVRCEYLKNPVGLDVLEPRISWKLTSEERHVRQMSYQLQIAADDDFSSIIWDSNEVISDKNLHITLTDIQLVSRKRYYVRVRVTDQKSNMSSWSDIAYFEMGLLTANEWQANWIIPPITINGEPCPEFKKTFHVSKKVTRARLYATALGLYELKLNGERVGDDYFTPGWTHYESRLQYQTYDVTDKLVAGEIEWTALLGNGWYKGNLGWVGARDIFGDRLALLAQLHIEYTDGSEEMIGTNNSWQVTASALQMSEIYHGETFDATATTSDWQVVETIDHPKDILVAQENEPVRKIETVRPQKLIQTPNGEVVIDFGQNLVGWVAFDIEGEAGQKLVIKHAEILDGDGNFYIDNLRTAKQTNTFIIKGDDKESFEPHFTFQGFRYVQLIGFHDNQLDLTNFRAVVLHSDMEFTGDFTCSDPLVNQLQSNIRWGLKGNFLDVPTDCPQRDERLGWTGDAQMFIRTASYLANVAPFFKKWLRDLKAEQLEDGSIPFVVPNVLIEDMKEPEDTTTHKPYGSAAWGDATVICPWTLYIAYGDERILAEQYDSMKAWVEYIKSQGTNAYLWNTGFHFGDWLALDAKPDSYIGATDRPYIATAFFAYSTSLVRKAAKILGKDEDYHYFSSLEDHIIKAFTNEYVTPNGRLAVPTQTAQLLALMFDLVDNKGKERAVCKLQELLEESDHHLTTGFVGTPYLNHVLTENGMNDAAYKLLFQQDYPSWLYQVTKGATTIWEHWDGIKEDGSFWSTNMNSFNHYAYGAIGDWLYRKVAGLELDEQIPGFKKFMIKPYTGDGLDYVEAKLESMYGQIRSAWKKTNTGIELEVTIPVNTTASIHLLNVDRDHIKIDQQNPENIEGVLLVTNQGKDTVVTVGSGTYEIVTSL